MQHDVVPSIREIGMTVTADDGLVMADTLALPAGNGPHPAVVLLCPGNLDREGSHSCVPTPGRRGAPRPSGHTTR
ncbi:hypothetical protein FHR32_007349 [Streptosporangium album]|uniref:Uncharacterized protein n=1 Tax=Streptosporangium album TaxID=47479 RepID=A0A7W7S2X2_9ACTN|nr:hypothetical protein [Streptosporangium album]MBB4942949.1 hypothetical protein [Streptosporangium album]